ncbi:MAG: isochorismatase, partial [Proteobacteria bacterium]|nr:isochorismatase [Pseudomonadota bacterium]
ESLEIYVPQDCIASRNKENWKNAVSQMFNFGVFVTNTETLVYQALQEAGNDMFRKYAKRLK